MLPRYPLVLHRLFLFTSVLASLVMGCTGGETGSGLEPEDVDPLRVSNMDNMPGNITWIAPESGALVSGTISLKVSGAPAGTDRVVFLAGEDLGASSIITSVAADRSASAGVWEVQFDTSMFNFSRLLLGALAKDSNGNKLDFKSLSVMVDGASGSTGVLPPTQPSDGTVVGYGASTEGGNRGPVIEVTSLAQLRSEISGASQSNPKNLRLQGSWSGDLNGNDLDISKPYVTIDGSGANVIFKRGSVKITASQVILRNIRSRASDEAGNAQNLDSITVNGSRAPVDHIILDHVEALWGPDVSGVFLGDISDITVQYSIYGEGLFHSNHPESGDADGHSLSMNIATESTDRAKVPRRLTFYGTLFTTSQSRSPRIIGGQQIDFVNCVFYNYDESPQGNAFSISMIGNTWKLGPASTNAGLGAPSKLLWGYQPGGHGAFDTLIPNAVYINDARTLDASGNDFTPQSPSGSDATVLRSSPHGYDMMVQPRSSATGYQMVIDQAGVRLPTTDADTTRLINNLKNGTGNYYNGAGRGAPMPSWPY